MSRKNILEPYKIYDAVSIAATVNSSTVNIKNLDKASIIVEWTGTSPVGVLTVEVRNKRENLTGTAWVTLDMGSAINITGNSGSHILRFDELPFSELRLTYTSTSGTGTINATVTGKQTGG